ncbi:MAG TPA: tRNA (guanosine(46)-N7)-methyltransferase TrmB [Candidatus Kapabacteria bacterium]|nr:tRNA (guanosine(46)-N7)-methyltransferase TrmB [Candidatus Kapabacteria bacterium]
MIDFKKYPFGMKIRHHVSATNYIPLNELPKFPDGYPPLIQFENWKQFFKNGKPVNVLDIGCGKGKFLLNYAIQNKNDNILGIELRTETIDWINGVIEGEEIENAKAIWYSVVNKLDFIDNNSIDRIFYLFPDPWPKNKHLKRRAFRLEFIEMCYDKLQINGQLILATDVDYVNEYQLKLLSKFQKFKIEILENREQWDYPITNKERFCLEKNIPVFRVICTK